MKSKLILYTYFPFNDQKDERILNRHSLYGYEELINEYEITNISYEANYFGLLNIFRILREVVRDKERVLYIPHDIRILWLHILKYCRIIENPVVFIIHNSFRTYSHYSLFRRIYYRLQRWVITKNYSTLLVLGEGVVQDNPDFFRNFVVRNLSWGMDIPYLIESVDRFDLFFAGCNKRDLKLLNELMINSEWTLISTIELDGNLSDRIKLQTISKTGTHQLPLLNAMNSCSCVLIPVNNEYDQVVGASVLVEALALGKTVVAPRQGAKLFDIESYGIGYFYDLGDVNSFREAVEKALLLFETEAFLVNLDLLRKKYNYSAFRNNLMTFLSD